MPTSTRPKGPAKEPSWELILKRNAIERHKKEKFPLDIIDELPDMIAKGYEAIPEEDIVFLSWYGLMHDKPKIGTFMVRVKVPGGRLSPKQLKALGEISRDRGRNYGELTTRQGIQLHWIALGELPEVLGRISDSGLTTTGGEGDTVRNVTGCPVGGVSDDELFDVSGLIDDVAKFFSGNREYSDLPRKHKYTIATCPQQCNAPEIHDVALIGMIKDGRNGFAIRIGGGLSATPRIAKDIGVFVPYESNEQIIEVLRAITDVWQNNPRYRVSRVKARIKHMMDDYGPEAMRAMIEKQLGYALEDGIAPEAVAGSGHVGVHRQRDLGRSYLGLPVTMGRVTGDQLIALGELLDGFGADARITRSQNLIIANIPTAQIAELTQKLEDLGFTPKRSNLYARSVACTDHQFCNYSVSETKGRLDKILPELENRFGAEAVAELGIHMDGCPHACAHHWVGDIGLQGTTATNKETGVRTEAYNLRLRGKLGAGAAIGTPLIRRIPADQITEVVCRLVGAYVDAPRETDEPLTFAAFLERHDDDALRSICAGDNADGSSGEQEQAATKPIVRIPGMLLDSTDGADVVEVDGTTVGAIIIELAARFPKLTAQMLDEKGDIIPSVNVFLGEEDIRFLQGLATPVAVGEELSILPALSGGC